MTVSLLFFIKVQIWVYINQLIVKLLGKLNSQLKCVLMKFAKYRTLVVNRLIFSFATYFLREQNNHIFFCAFKLVLNINYCHFCNKEKCNCKVSVFKYFRTDAKYER